MHLTRRKFLSGVGGYAALPVSAPWAKALPIKLRAMPGLAQLVPATHPATSIWGYDGVVPGPSLVVRQGERLSVRFANALPQASTVHWHGIRIENAMDGVAGLTQAPVPANENFDYSFTLPDAGTYWYHPHNRTWEQMARGLYGALIVEETNPPGVDRDLVLLLDDWRLTDDAQIADTFGQMHDWSHAGRLGNWITVNGTPALEEIVRANDRLRLRLVNTSNARVFDLKLKGLGGWVMALDGQPLDRPRPATQITLAPAQRVDLIVDVRAKEGEEAFLISNERDGGFALATFGVTGAQRSEPLLDRPILLPNPVAKLGPLEAARRATLRMEGGAMGGMTSAVLEGQQRSMQELVRAGYAWAVNGMAGLPERPLLDVDLGETVRITMVNETVWPHAMHLHGHHFRQIGSDGSTGPLRDTLLLQRGETAEIAFSADNPGKWLLHCHMLEHSASGMMTWLNVAA